MASAEMVMEGPPLRLATASRGLFVVTILAGSFLLFLVQPMVARLALPRLGGTPAVWNSAMLVYQALLLAGYGYAHMLGRLAPRGQALVHLAVLVAAAAWLPIGLVAMDLPAGQSPALWVPWLLLVSIGPLFFAVAAQAPMMQRWFAASVPGLNPYALYAASNLGSFGGLMAYPLIVEPLMAVTQQRYLWSAGYAVLTLLVAACALTLPRAGTATVRTAAASADPAPGWRAWARWIALAAIPSGLMLSTTTHLSTDIGAMPLIWVVPLGLYLLSFSIAFAEKRRLATLIARPFPVLLVASGQMVFANAGVFPALAGAIDLLLLFVVAVALHAELYRTRPPASRLTSLYLAMSIGGVLGGALCALVAPLLFDWVYEHPLLILAAALMMPQASLVGILRRARADPARGRRLDRALAVAAVLLGLVAAVTPAGAVPVALQLALIWLLAVLAFAGVGRRPLFGLALAAVMLASGGWQTILPSTQAGTRVRSYFGIYIVRDQADGTRTLMHGTTTHGVQRREPGRERTATSYYAPRSGVGEAMRAAPDQFGAGARIGVVGLGAGTLACYARPGEHWRFYEIDPAVARIARDPAKFTFLSRCLPDAPIVIGDARLRLAEDWPASLDLLVVDAFSSDSVPMHLLTDEAFAIYRRALAPGGLLLVHISNRFFDLEPVLAAAARDGRLATAVRDYTPSIAEGKAGAYASTWVALAADPAVLARLVARDRLGWRDAAARPGFAAWSDDHASVLPLIKGW